VNTFSFVQSLFTNFVFLQQTSSADDAIFFWSHDILVGEIINDKSFLLVIILGGLLIIAFVVITMFQYKRRKFERAEQAKRIEEHKIAIHQRLQHDEVQQRFITLDFSIYENHKNALSERIKKESWFAVFTDLFFSQHSMKISFEPLISKKGDDRKLSLLDLADFAEYQPVLLIGDAGSGKTTSLNRLAVHLCESRDNVPLILDLASFRQGHDLIKMMNTERKLEYHDIEQALKSGVAVVLVDSINETSDSDTALDSILELNRSYRNNRYIVATRISHYFASSGKLSSFSLFEIQPLTIDQIKDFLAKFLGGENLALNLIGHFDQRLLGLSGNPYILEMIATLYQDTGEIGSNRAEIYQKFLYRLLYHWDRKIKHTVFQGFMEDVLASVCYQLDQRTTAHYIPDVQNAVAFCLPQINKKMSQEYDTKTVWDDIKTLAVVRLDSRTSKFMFIHQSIQEYFAGLHLYRRLIEGSLTVENIVENALNIEWHEPITFAAGLIEDSTPLIYKLVDKKLLYLSALCLENSKTIRPELADNIVVAALTEFKYGQLDESVAVVSYNSIIALRMAQYFCSHDLEPRIRENIKYFVEKYATIDNPRITFASSQYSTEDLLVIISKESQDPLLPDYIWTLGERSATSCVGPLLDLMRQKNFLYRVEVVRALGKVGSSKTAENLLPLLSEENESGLYVAVLNAILHLHNRVGVDVDIIEPYLVQFIHDSTKPYRESAAWALRGLVGAKGTPTFQKYALDNRSQDLQAMCIYILGELRVDKSSDDLVALLRGEMGYLPIPFVREDIVYALGFLFPTPTTISALINALSDSDSVVRMHAIMGLARHNLPDEYAISGIKSLTQDTKRYVAIAAKHVLTVLFWRRYSQDPNVTQEEIITKMDNLISALNQLGSRSAALQNRINETKKKESEGFLDTGRSDALLLRYEQERFQILVEIESLLSDSPIVSLVPAVERARNGASEDEVRVQIKDVVKTQGWGGSILSKVDQYKGEILGMIIVASLEVARYLSGRS